MPTLTHCFRCTLAATIVATLATLAGCSAPAKDAADDAAEAEINGSPTAAKQQDEIAKKKEAFDAFVRAYEKAPLSAVHPVSYASLPAQAQLVYRQAAVAKTNPYGAYQHCVNEIAGYKLVLDVGTFFLLEMIDSAGVGTVPSPGYRAISTKHLYVFSANGTPLYMGYEAGDMVRKDDPEASGTITWSATPVSGLPASACYALPLE